MGGKKDCNYYKIGVDAWKDQTNFVYFLWEEFLKKVLTKRVVNIYNNKQINNKQNKKGGKMDDKKRRFRKVRKGRINKIDTLA